MRKGIIMSEKKYIDVNELSHSRRLACFVTIIISVFSSNFLSTARGYVLPYAMGQFNAYAYYALLVVLASCTMTAVIPIAGKLGDQFGRKPIFIGGNILYLITIIMCGLSKNGGLALFMFGVILSGIGQGFNAAFVNVMIGDIMGREQSQKYVGYNSTVSNTITLAVPIISGIIIDKIGWHFVFWIILPVSILSLILLFAIYPTTQPVVTTKPKIDWAGTAALLAFIVPGVIMLSIGGTMIPYTSPLGIAMLVVCLVSLFLLIYIESKAPEAILPKELVKFPSFVKLFFASLLFNFGMVGMMTYFPLYLTNVRQLSATMAGTFVTPRNILGIILVFFTGIYLNKTKKFKQTLLLYCTLAAIGYGIMTAANTNTPVWLLMFGTILTAFGAGILMTTAIMMIMYIVPPQNIGSGVALIVLTSSLSGTIGSGIAGKLLNNATAHFSLPETLMAALNPEQVSTLLNPSILSNAADVEAIRATLSKDLLPTLDTALDTIRSQYGGGLSHIFAFYMIGVIIAAILIITIKLNKSKQQ